MIQEVSTKFCKLYNYDENEIIGQNISTIQHEKCSSTEMQKYMLEMIHNKQSMSIVHDFKTKDGKHLECDMTMHPHFGDDGYVNGYSFYQDLIHI